MIKIMKPPRKQERPGDGHHVQLRAQITAPVHSDDANLRPPWGWAKTRLGC